MQRDVVDEARHLDEPQGCVGRAARKVPRDCAAQLLANADPSWLEKLVIRRVGPDAFDQALERAPDDIKVVTEFAEWVAVRTAQRHVGVSR